MKLQPTSEQFREQLVLAADRIIEQGFEIERLRVRWWQRFAWWRT